MSLVPFTNVCWKKKKKFAVSILCSGRLLRRVSLTETCLRLVFGYVSSVSFQPKEPKSNLLLWPKPRWSSIKMFKTCGKHRGLNLLFIIRVKRELKGSWAVKKCKSKPYNKRGFRGLWWMQRSGFFFSRGPFEFFNLFSFSSLETCFMKWWKLWWKLAISCRHIYASEHVIHVW
jgi:hypothetical protein